MGFRHSFNIYIPRERAWRLLAAVAENEDRHAGDGWAAVRIDDRRVVLPYLGWQQEQRGVTQQIRRDADGPDTDASAEVDLVLRFHPDEHLRDYFAPESFGGEGPARVPDATGRYQVGLIYLSIGDERCPMPDHLRFRFGAATTDMSMLFWRSESIRDWFVWMTKRTGASVCTFDMDGLIFIYYAHGRRTNKSVDTEADETLEEALTQLEP